MKDNQMVEKALDIAANVAKFAPKGCKASNAFVIVICFTALGLLAGFFIGSYLTP
jgi:hypothetical protein